MLEKIVQSPFLWSLLCLVAVLTYYKSSQVQTARLQRQADAREKAITKLYEDHRKESNLREEKLMTHLDKTTQTLGHIEQGLSKIENKMDGGFQEVWEQIESIKEGRSTHGN